MGQRVRAVGRGLQCEDAVVVLARSCGSVCNKQPLHTVLLSHILVMFSLFATTRASCAGSCGMRAQRASAAVYALGPCCLCMFNSSLRVRFGTTTALSQRSVRTGSCGMTAVHRPGSALASSPVGAAQTAGSNSFARSPCVTSMRACWKILASR